MSRPLETAAVAGTALALVALIVVLVHMAARAPHSAPTMRLSSGATLAVTAPTFVPINAVQSDDMVVQILRPSQLCGWPLVAEVTLGQPQPARWNVPGGQRPADALTGPQAQAHGEQIVTPLQFTRFVALSDHHTIGVVTQEYDVEGGNVGVDHLSVLGAPQFQTGEQAAIIFVPGVQPASAAGPATHTERSMLVWAAFPVDAQGRVVFQAASQADDQGNPALPLIASPLNDVVQALAVCH